MKIDLGSQQIECHVEYSSRKKISIELHASGLLIVKAPNRTEDEVIIQTLKQYENKILKQLHALEAARSAPRVKEYDEEGQGKFLHLGKYYSLHELIETNGRTEEELQQDLKKFYFASLKKVIGERIKIYQKQLKVQPKSYTIEESNTKWGSCNSSKHLTFNYRLAMAPLEVIDYVVIHELCHLLHMNHDRSFWRRVGSIMKDYKEKETFLARYGQAMTL
ncbi:M48 family metallopeptidase [Paenibacillus solani]|uniref:M48 family metallopeptidase n=1 Tax=Paenibacillus solani TaxID=1705565 RepID=UPI003D2B2FD4